MFHTLLKDVNEWMVNSWYTYLYLKVNWSVMSIFQGVLLNPTIIVWFIVKIEYFNVDISFAFKYVIKKPFIYIISDFKYIKSRRGKQLILYKEHTYFFKHQSITKRTTYWQCTMKQCRSKLVVDDDGSIISGNEDHCHVPPKYFVANGQYFRI